MSLVLDVQSFPDFFVFLGLNEAHNAEGSFLVATRFVRARVIELARLVPRLANYLEWMATSY